MRVAVDDWPQMVAMMRECAATVDSYDLPIDATLISESAHLLDWMADNHFTFLGYQEYSLRNRSRTLTLTPIPGTGLGLLADHHP